jgi:hypothetical protein
MGYASTNLQGRVNITYITLGLYIGCPGFNSSSSVLGVWGELSFNRVATSGNITSVKRLMIIEN